MPNCKEIVILTAIKSHFHILSFNLHNISFIQSLTPFIKIIYIIKLFINMLLPCYLLIVLYMCH